MNTSLLEQELAPLNAQVREIRRSLAELERGIREAEGELQGFSADRQRFDALREACTALERLGELEAAALFWGGLPEVRDPSGHITLLRSGIASFDEKIDAILTREAGLRKEADRCVERLDFLYDEIDEAHDRDERRAEEFAIVRELSPVPHHPLLMPWSNHGESDRRYRRSLQTAMFASLVLAIIIRLVTVPVPVRPAVVQVPERLAMMVRQAPPKPVPAKKTVSEPKDAKKEAKAEGKPAEKQAVAKASTPAPDRPLAAPAAQTASPKRSESAGVLAFKESFRDLIDETPVARLGTEARLSGTGQSGQAARSLVTMEGGGRGGGGNGAVSRNAGSGGIGGGAGLGRGVGGGGGNEARIGQGGGGFAQVKSTIAAPGTKEAKAAGSAGRPARTDEEIQILFDRYKAALYRIYNTELRKDPTLRGKMVLRITIEPSGVVSACAVDSTNMEAQGFSDQIVERVKKFNFGPKDGVPKTTILYPIDFLPAR